MLKAAGARSAFNVPLGVVNALRWPPGLGSTPAERCVLGSGCPPGGEIKFFTTFLAFSYFPTYTRTHTADPPRKNKTTQYGIHSEKPNVYQRVEAPYVC